MADFKIVMTGHGRGEVFMDGEKLEHVRGVKFAAEVDSTNIVTVSFVAGAVDIEAASIEVTSVDSESREYVKNG